MKLTITTIILFFTCAIFSQNRPQEPKEPFNYTIEDISFTNTKAENIKLAGTLTLPKNVKKPAVAILISGSGPQDRNESLAGHKPFLVLADYLTNNGIAILRYDDRGTAKSEGDFMSATTFDFATDTEAAVTYLKTRNDIDISKIGLIGHSEGGLIAPIVASRNKDIAFLISLAGTGVDGKIILETQTRRAAELVGAPKSAIDENEKLTNIIYGAVQKHDTFENIKAEVSSGLKAFKVENPNSQYASLITDAFIEQQANAVKSSWLQTFIKTDPKDYLSRTTCPILALNGSKDYQVLPKLNLEAIEIALKKAGNKDVTIKQLEGLNHLFQTAETGSGQEYAKIEETFSPRALVIIKDWILKRF
ncbi:alpha/beta hydrolase [uncultured Lacinutrix sp.]|uniref:alpha/beta hydrolase family protein n=1 Tax=uncultured Lacinutrix sp. TaxID=574032 RepID=UPI0026206B48|nr:alpha/beta hydrolase [uncultured Lacinutrix sp.]